MGDAIGGIAGGIAGLTQSSKGGASKTPITAARSSLEGWQQSMPLALNLSRGYQPAFLQQGGQNLQQLLFGSPEQIYNQSVGYGKQRKNGTWEKNANVSVNSPASIGLLDTLGQAAPRLQDLYQQGARRGVESNMGLLNDYLPQAQSYYDEASPELMALRRQMGLDASQQLALGNQLDPNDAYRISQSVRANYANRGLGRSNQADLSQALSLYGSGENLRAQRQGYAGNTANLLSQTQPDYSRFIMGLGGNPVGDTLSFISNQQPVAYQGNTFDPYNPTAAQLSATGLGYSQWFDTKRMNSTAAIGKGVGDIAGSFMTGGMGM